MQNSSIHPFAVEVENVCKSVQDSSGILQILDHMSFVLPWGSSTAIRGASGSGKSTLLSLLAGLDTPSEGKIVVAGQNIFALDEDARAAWRAKTLGFVFQGFQLLPHLTALENVMLPLQLQGLKSARARAQDILARVGLATRLQHRPATLSGGEQQRVALARAFVVEPSLLLADEPTGSLDHHTGQQIMDLMLELNVKHQTTLILVTHDAQLAQRCQQQLTMHAGKIQSNS